MHRLVALLFAISMFHSTRALAQADVGVPSDVSPCGAPLAETLFARIPETSRAPFFLVPPADGPRPVESRPARVIEVELDGRAPREAVLLLETILTGEPGASGAFVLACRTDGWTYVERIVLDVDAWWDGTIDGQPGFASVTAETIAGVGHELLRLEHVDLRGGADPRFLRHRVVYAHLVNGAVVTALDVVTSELIVGGPERETISETTRALRLAPGRAPRYRFVFTRREEQPRRRRACSTWLVFDGRTFVPRDAACAAR